MARSKSAVFQRVVLKYPGPFSGKSGTVHGLNTKNKVWPRKKYCVTKKCLIITYFDK